MNLFKQDAIDLFSGMRGGHVEHWLYSDTLREKFSGSQLWYEFLKSSRNYYLLRNEIEVIQRLAQTFNNQTNNIDTVVNFGVGETEATTQKVFPIIHGLKNVQLYVGVDVSRDFLDNTEQVIANEFPQIKTMNIQSDFYNNSFAIPGDKQLGLMLGSTITNQNMKEGDKFPREQIVDRLRHLRTLIGNDNEMLITYDANSDVRSAMAAYKNKYWSKHVTGLMYDVAKIAEGDFYAKAWRHRIIWNEHAHVIHQCAEATKDMSFKIDDNKFKIRSGQRFVTVNNFKYPTALFQSLCKDADFGLKGNLSDHQNRMQLQHLIA